MRLRHLPAMLLCLLIPGAARGGGEDPPQRLSQTGLYADPASHQVDAANRAYAPQYPLWSDGAAKRRWVYLPTGSRIDAAAPDAWKFPVGTRFWKEFSFGGKRVETRLLWRSARGWDYATYLWDPKEADAALAPKEGVKGHLDLGEGRSHAIPSVKDCRTCHENGGPEVLGFNALQLSSDRDPGAPHAEPLEPGMVTLADLLKEGRLEGAPAAWATAPPRIPAATPRERAAVGYLAANCGNCHPGTSAALARLGFDLTVPSRATAAKDLPWRATALDVPGKTSIQGAPEGGARRNTPGAPDLSLLVHRMASRRPARQMPPLGSALPDSEALALIRAWIAEDLPGKKP